LKLIAGYEKNDLTGKSEGDCKGRKKKENLIYSGGVGVIIGRKPLEGLKKSARK